MTTATFGTYVSADSHVTEPPEVWTDRLDAEFRDRAPILAHPPGMGATIVIDPGTDAEQQVPFGRIAAAGRVLQGGEDGWSWDELHPGGYDAAARIEEQIQDGIAAEVIYPSVGMMLCNHPDLAYKKACFDAYNDWIAEWCSSSPDRLVGLGQTAMRTPEEGIADLEKIKALGLRGVMLPGIPALEDYDSPIYDPVWEAIVDLGLPASFHILTAGGEKWWRGPNMNGFLGVIHANQDLIGMLVLGGVFERHPQLKVVNVEADAGWAPHYMFRMDTLFERHHKWVPSGVLSRKPSDYFRENIYMTFQDDRVAFQCIDMLEVGRLMWACDHPHSDATWPHSQEILDLNTGHLTEHQRNRIVRDNCAELYGIDVDALATRRMTDAAGPERELLGLWDCVALVTGGARPRPRVRARAARAGCHIAVADVADASETVAEVEALDRRAIAVSADIRSPDGAAAMVADAVDALGPFTVAVNTVGGTRGMGPFLDLDAEQWESVVALNTSSALWSCQAEARRMIADGVPGSIVNLGSLSGLEAAPNVVDYGAANAAVIHLTRSIALELAPHGIRVNCIVPGAHHTETVAAAAAGSPDVASWVERNAAATPLGRLGDPLETGGVAVFLASRLSSYVTGQEIVVDGGMQHTTARPPVGQG